MVRGPGRQDGDGEGHEEDVFLELGDILDHNDAAEDAEPSPIALGSEILVADTDRPARDAQANLDDINSVLLAYLLDLDPP